MENRYFKRDISWLSFNYRVLLEAEDDTLPLYERINFISIYSSNLEEFYKIRVADHKAIATGASQSDEETVQSAAELVDEINREVNRQLEDRIRIYEQKILPALRKHHIIFYQSRNVEPFHNDFVRNFFREEIFPYLAPVPVSKDKVISFLRDNRLYLDEGTLKVELFGRGFAWLDTGNCDSLLEASNFVATIQNRQGFRVSCIEEIAWRKGWIDVDQLYRLGEQLGKTEYGKYLMELAESKR